MKTLISTLLLLYLAFPLQAGLYKGLDEEGNVTYSDQPFKHSKPMTPPSISVVGATKVPKKSEPTDSKELKKPAAVTKYTRFGILSPQNQQTIWNNKDLSVSLAVTPALNTKAGDYIQLLMDGKTVVKKSRKLSLALGYVDRGQHRLQAMIRNHKGKVIKRSKAITVYIKQSVPKKQPRAQ